MNCLVVVVGLVCLLSCLSGLHSSTLAGKEKVLVEKSPETRLIEQEVCYGDLGCFSTGGHFYDLKTRPIQFLPQRPDYINVRFALYRRNHVLTPNYLVYDDSSSLSNSDYDGDKETKLIIHGFLENGDVNWMHDMKKAYLIRGDYNVIQVDWSKGNQLPYTQATANTRVAGAVIARMIKWLEQETGTSREKFHLAGHSLGAHISGYAGERLNDDELGVKLGRITGLDPAGPYFENTHFTVRLDPTDARFVDAIHTDGDSVLNTIKLNGGFGLMQPVGHVDFYPNGGMKQPDCSKNPIINIIINGIVDGTKWTVACYHLRVLPLYTNTILHNAGDYMAYPCDSYEDLESGKCLSCGDVGCASMGLKADEWKRNGKNNVKMYLKTTGKEPFEAHHYRTRISISPSSVSSKRQYGELRISFVNTVTNQRTNEIQFASKMYYRAGESYDLLATDTQSPIAFDRVELRFKHQWWFSVLTQKLYVDQVEVLEGFNQRRTLYCNHNEAIVSNKPVGISKTDKC